MWPSYLSKLKRGPQVVLPKDLGVIIAFADINKDSFVLDAGAGSGWLAVGLGRVAARVVSYEVREDFAKLAANNVQRIGLSNVEVRLRDILALGFDEKDADAVCLDMADADKAIPMAAAALKSGGVLVGYAPQTEQLSAFVSAGLANGIGDWFCCESLLRPILVRPSGVRPANVMISHTGFLAFGRKGAAADGGQSGQKQKRFKELMAPLSGPRPEKARKKKAEDETGKNAKETAAQSHSQTGVQT